MARTYTDAEKQAAVALYETDGPSAVQKKLGIPKGTLDRWVKKAGAQTVRNDRTHEATKAAQMDNKLRRQDIISKMYTRSNTVLDRLNAPTFRALVPVAPGRQEPQDLDFVPATEERALSGSVGTYLTSAANLEKLDADNGAAEAVSMLGRLAGELGVSRASSEPEATTVPERVNEAG